MSETAARFSASPFRGRDFRYIPVLEWCAIAQGAGLLHQHRQIMSGIVDNLVTPEAARMIRDDILTQQNDDAFGMGADDIKTLFLRALFAWFIGDGDMHLKNLALLKMAEEGADHFRSVRFAPVYDAVTTRVIPGLQNDHMALKLNGRDDRLGPDDFLTLARTIELPLRWASETMAKSARNIVAAAGTTPLPERYEVEGGSVHDQVRAIVMARTEPFI